ncbi:helicase-associated domain-containing protein [Streptomyces sp. NPDC059740]|uniref:helicase-associated domain-containing protein n=1 Tax=Streptomyces sp. NPDC059740 TaxID=3346926 RepID=UPI00364C36FD
MSPSSAPRTLAEELRARTDDELSALLRARPDLLNPVPGDLTQLATRAGTRASVARAVERLDRFALQTAEALAVAPDPCPTATLLALLTGDGTPSPLADGTDHGPPADAEAVAERLPHALATLRTRALVWGPEDRLRLVRTARELLSPAPTRPSPTGLGPTVAEAAAGMSPGRLQDVLAAAGLPPTHDPVSAVAALSALFEDRAALARLLDQAPEESTAVLRRLVWGPPYGSVTDRPGPHLRWLLDRGLLLPHGARGVVLPREAALGLRAGRAHRAPEPLPPALAPATTRDPHTVDQAAAGQAFTALATVEELLKEWHLGGPPVLRAGGLSVRDLRRTATALDVPEQQAAFWLELAYAAGLLASDGEADERYAPTPYAEEWREKPEAERWVQLAAAWLAATRTPGLVGGADAKGRGLSALGPHLDRSAAPEVRRRALTLLAQLPAGTSVPARALLDRMHWERPLRAPGPAEGDARTPQPPAGTPQDGGEDLRTRLARWALEEAETLGVTGRGALASPARALLGLPADEAAPATGDGSWDAAAGPAPAPEQRRRAAAALAPLLPEPTDQVLLQADLTAVAPGPLRRPLADALDVLADVESKGGATVYRFTPGSVRRALDAGRSAAELQEFLARHSATPVPQPLAYLIDDVARRHGQVRVGAVASYVRCDDEAVLAEILAAAAAGRRTEGLRLRRLAPTVLASTLPPEELLAGLRALGYAPAAESQEGDVLVARPDAYRTPPRSAPVPVPEGPPPPDARLLSAAVRAVRAGDMAATAERRPVAQSGAAPGELPRTTSAETLAAMQAAALTGSAVWIGFVGAEGSASQRVIAPLRVEGGFVTAYDHTADEVRTFPLHRVTGVAELAEDPSG